MRLSLITWGPVRQATKSKFISVFIHIRVEHNTNPQTQQYHVGVLHKLNYQGAKSPDVLVVLKRLQHHHNPLNASSVEQLFAVSFRHVDSQTDRAETPKVYFLIKTLLATVQSKLTVVHCH